MKRKCTNIHVQGQTFKNGNVAEFYPTEAAATAELSSAKKNKLNMGFDLFATCLLNYMLQFFTVQSLNAISRTSKRFAMLANIILKGHIKKN